MAARPGWDCADCGKPWPCDPARGRLAAEHADFPTVLRIYMLTMLGDARAELPDVADLDERFLDWAPTR